MDDNIWVSYTFQLSDDNSGEFVNEELIEYGVKYNVIILTKPAESAWLNRLCEKANKLNIRQTMRDSGSLMNMGIHWDVVAKNSLSSVYGFSLNQLVLGHNIDLPHAFTNKLPVQNTTCVSKYLAQTVKAMHAAREAHIKQESFERLKRALSKQTRTYLILYSISEIVCTKREFHKDYHGPAEIFGHYRAEHGGTKMTLQKPLKTKTAFLKGLLNNIPYSAFHNHGFTNEPSST